MFNAVRMDIYRLIHTKSAYVILVIAMALAIAMSGMTALVRSMAAESIVETTDEVTMVSESDSEIADEYDTASVESSNGPTATVGLEVDNSDMSDEVPTIADMVESDIAGLDLKTFTCDIYGALFNSRPKQRLYKERRRTGEVPWSAAVFKDDSAFGIYLCGHGT